MNFRSYTQLNSDFDNIFVNRAVTKIEIGSNGSFINVQVIKGICYAYIEMYAADIPTIASYNSAELCIVPDGYRPSVLIWTIPQNIDGKNSWQGCKLGITSEGIVQLTTRWAAISPTENSSKAYARFFYPISL